MSGASWPLTPQGLSGDQGQGSPSACKTDTQKGEVGSAGWRHHSGLLPPAQVSVSVSKDPGGGTPSASGVPCIAPGLCFCWGSPAPSPQGPARLVPLGPLHTCGGAWRRACILWGACAPRPGCDSRSPPRSCRCEGGGCDTKLPAGRAPNVRPAQKCGCAPGASVVPLCELFPPVLWSVLFSTLYEYYFFCGNT